MRKLLISLAIVAALGSGFLAYTRVFARSEPAPVNELGDCSMGFVTAPSVDALGVEQWPPPKLFLEPVLDVPEPTSAAKVGDAALITTRHGDVYWQDGSLAWTEPNITSDGPEQGLLDVAIDESRELVLTSLTGPAGDLTVRSRSLESLSADDYRVIISIPEPTEIHNGGDVEIFDGHMFLSVGDGGAFGDPHDNAQSLGSLHGSILRLSHTADGYTIPSDNPTVDGDPGAHWAHGLRNPWRISIDPTTSLLWIADVGAACVEEINVMPAKGVEHPPNYGWPALEGSSRGRGDVPVNQTPPFIEYPRTGDRCGVIGGRVYRGKDHPGLKGMYVFGDICQRRLLALDTSAASMKVYDLGVEAPGNLKSIAEIDGELWVLSHPGGVLALRGEQGN